MNSRLIIILSLFLPTFPSCDFRQDEDNRQWTYNDKDLLLTLLDQSLSNLMDEVSTIAQSEWNSRPDSMSWSPAEVIEHLIVHEELFYRELTVISALTEMEAIPASRLATDQQILDYGFVTEGNSGPAPWYLEPKGRWQEKTTSLDHYHLYRHKMMELVANTDSNFRKYYTTSGRGPTKYRDLHQLALVSVAHTIRHHQQIRNIKSALNIL